MKSRLYKPNQRTVMKYKAICRFDKVLDIYEDRNFTDVVGTVGGDIITKRVRKTENGYFVTVR